MSDFPSPLHDAILPCIEISLSWPFRRTIRGGDGTQCRLELLRRAFCSAGFPDRVKQAAVTREQNDGLADGAGVTAIASKRLGN
jgi:hypothetical protein